VRPGAFDDTWQSGGIFLWVIRHENLPTDWP
jgi:hypothetical protein